MAVGTYQGVAGLAPLMVLFMLSSPRQRPTDMYARAPRDAPARAHCPLLTAHGPCSPRRTGGYVFALALVAVPLLVASVIYALRRHLNTPLLPSSKRA